MGTLNRVKKKFCFLLFLEKLGFAALKAIATLLLHGNKRLQPRRQPVAGREAGWTIFEGGGEKSYVCKRERERGGR